MSGDLAVIHPELAQLASARAALEASRDLGEVKAIRDLAAAAQKYAQARKLGQDAVHYAQEIVNRAERRIGQLIAATPREPGPGRGKTLAPDANVSSARGQVGYAVSKRAQQLAAIPDNVFDANAHKPVTRLARVAREAALAERRSQPVEPVSVLGGVEIRHCSLTGLEVEPGSAALVLTDPPYPGEYLPLWSDLGALAARALAPGRPLVAYSSEYHLPEVMARLGEHLTFTWTLKLRHIGPTTHIRQSMIYCDTKLLLVYSRGRYQPRGWLHDTITGGVYDKSLHEWQQAVEPVAALVDELTEPGELVIDPFLGSGTTALACKQLGRRFIGCDTDAGAVAAAVERVA